MITRRSSKKRTLLSLSAAVLPLFALATPASAATSLSQFGITWTFDKDYPSGQFANGDYWVVGPVKIVSISPKSTTASGRTINGSMVNPAVGKAQGYDSATYANYGTSYSGNVAAGVSSTSPLTLNAGSSLVSSISNSTAGARPQLTSAAILTVLPSAAPAGSFRPPYTGTDKTLRWNKSQLKYSLLRSLPKVANTPALSTVEARFERPWLEHNPDWTGRYIHPSGNMPDYGRDMANTLAEGLLSLHLDYTAAQKEKLLIRLVQYGIDVYGVAKAGGTWQDLGGHNQGRKMPMVLAGMMLGDSNILALADGSKKIFQEDRQTWYVTTADVGRTLYTADGRPREKYISADVGIAEWGEQHTRQPNRDGRNWDAYYRDVCGHSFLGHALAARLMKAETQWAWAPFLDYADRYWAKEKASATGVGNAIRPFIHAMWTAHRNATSGSYTEDNVAVEQLWQNSAFAAQSGTFTLAYDMVASQLNIDGVTGLSSGVADAYTDLAATVRFNTSGKIDALNGTAYQAASSLSYTAGVTYRVVMTVDVAAKRYSASVTPAGGSPVTIASNYAFRSTSTATSLNNVGFTTTAGAISVLNVALQTPAPAPTPEPTPEPAPTTPDSGTTYVSTAAFQNIPVAVQKGIFTLNFDVTPSALGIDAVTGLSNGAADAYADLATTLRFSKTGYIDARHGTGFKAATSLKYVAGVKYSVQMTVNVTKRTYSVKVTPAGGSTVTIATDWKFRDTQATATQLSSVGFTASKGSHKLANVVLVGQ
ncbi:MAG TPA: hypothetical protein VGD81_20520 [Opitutaceae bacterium]